MLRSWAGLAGRAAVVVAVLALSGCAGSTSSGSPEPPTGTFSSTGSSTTSTTPPADPPGKGCPYLTADQVGGVVGTSMSETAGSVHACFFDPLETGGPSVMLSRIDIQIDPTDYARESKALCKGDVTDLDLGNESFACLGALGPQGQLYEDRVLVTVAVDGATDEATGIADAAELLRVLTIPPQTH